MVSPLLQKKSEQNLTVDQDAIELFKAVYLKQNKKESSGEEKIVVSDLISKVAFYYEKIRNSVDYNEEYLLRKNAIERILKRQIIIEGIIKTSKSEEMSKHLLLELIRAGYLPNNSVPESKIGEIKKIIEKYILLRNEILPKFEFSLQGNKSEKKHSFEEKNNMNNWIISVLASDVETALGLDLVKDVVVKKLYKYLLDNIKLLDNSKYEDDLDIQIYLGIYRNFLKFDEGMFRFILLKYYYESWENPNDENIKQLAENIKLIQEKIEYQINHPLVRQIDKVVSKYSVYFTILIDVITEDPVLAFDTAKDRSDKFPVLIKKTFNKKYEERKLKLKRAGVRSIIYIFLTKSVFVFLLEIPATKLFGEEIEVFALAINVLFPPVLLFFAVFFTQLSSDKNMQKIIEGVEEILFQEKRKKGNIFLKKPVKRSFVKGLIFNSFYSATFLLSFGFVVWGLDKLNFNWVSITIFLFFLTFVSFFAIRIRTTTREFIVVEPSENIFTFFTDFFSIPIISVGKWLSSKFSKINIFVIILDFIIEAPFKVFIEMAEDWTRYVKERKDDII